MGMDQYIYYGHYNLAFNNWQSTDDDQEEYYFRKFYTLHHWIFDNCVTRTGTPDANGFVGDKVFLNEKDGDNCIFIPVKKSKWKELYYSLCKLSDVFPEVKDDEEIDEAEMEKVEAMAEEVGMTASSLFGPAYDKWYIRDINYLKSCVKEILEHNSWDEDGLLEQLDKKEPKPEDVKRIQELDTWQKEQWKAYCAFQHQLYDQLAKEFDESGRSGNIVEDEKLPNIFSDRWNNKEFAAEFDKRMDAWEKENDFDNNVNIYEKAGITQEDVSTAKAIGYYAWY